MTDIGPLIALYIYSSFFTPHLHEKEGLFILN